MFSLRHLLLFIFSCIAILEFSAFGIDVNSDVSSIDSLNASPSPSPSVSPEPDASPSPVVKKRMPPPKFNPKLKKEELIKTEEAEIPAAPTAPPRLEVPTPKDGFECPRKLIYEGREISCDSYLKEDGERLRPIVSSVPESVKELNQYQDTKRNIHNAAYVGTVGLVMIIAGVIAPKFIDMGDRVLVRNRLAIPGAMIMFGSLGVSLYLLHDNEKHIGNAVKYFNQANPENPIQLLFSTGVSF